MRNLSSRPHETTHASSVLCADYSINPFCGTIASGAPNSDNYEWAIPHPPSYPGNDPVIIRNGLDRLDWLDEASGHIPQAVQQAEVFTLYEGDIDLDGTR